MFETFYPLQPGERVSIKKDQIDFFDGFMIEDTQLFIDEPKPSDHTGLWFTLKDRNGTTVYGKKLLNGNWSIVFPGSWFERIIED
ncbi:MAG: hypothetical protein AAB507_01030 [Patescibacteria group bacterium]